MAMILKTTVMIFFWIGFIEYFESKSPNCAGEYIDRTQHTRQLGQDRPLLILN
jgi:hypothetical protein